MAIAKLPERNPVPSMLHGGVVARIFPVAVIVQATLGVHPEPVTAIVPKPGGAATGVTTSVGTPWTSGSGMKLEIETTADVTSSSAITSLRPFGALNHHFSDLWIRG